MDQFISKYLLFPLFGPTKRGKNNYIHKVIFAQTILIFICTHVYERILSDELILTACQPVKGYFMPIG